MMTFEKKERMPWLLTNKRVYLLRNLQRSVNLPGMVVTSKETVLPFFET